MKKQLLHGPKAVVSKASLLTTEHEDDGICRGDGRGEASKFLRIVMCIIIRQSIPRVPGHRKYKEYKADTQGCSEKTDENRVDVQYGVPD